MKRRVVMTIALLLLSSACTGGAEGTFPGPGRVPKYPEGGTLRVASEHHSFDPQASYSAADWEVLRCCLLRMLFTYNGRPTEEGGAILRPDLASGMGSPSPDGLTWTFHLKTGIHYAPPFEETTITAGDIARALERTGVLFENGFSTSFYYVNIDGLQAFEAGTVDSISGVIVPNDRTLVVRLLRPEGDLPYLFAMPTTAPIPEGAAVGHHGDYERFLVSSGPYMFEGSPAMDFSVPPAQQEPVSGYEPDLGRATLVRNPSWDPATDGVRGAYVDRIELALHEVRDEAGRARRAGQVERDELDLLLDDFALSINPEDGERYRADPSLVGGVLTAQESGISSLEMDLAMPPFDDLDVRRAVMYAIDREAIFSGAGLAFAGVGELPQHLAPDSLESELLASYDPYPDPAGDLESARRAMAASRYDHDGDGVCDDPVCRGVIAGGFVRIGSRQDDESLSVRTSLRAIGIRLHVRFLPDNSTLAARLREGRIEMMLEVSSLFVADYPNATQFFTDFYSSAGIDTAGDGTCCNRTLVGASPEQLRALGHDPVDTFSVDDRIEACQIAIGSDQPTCWAELDQYMMEQVVPVVPILFPGIQTPFSTRVLHASIDQWTAVPALDQVALVPGA
jgi:ABC-type transport system substrate-binding protein